MIELHNDIIICKIISNYRYESKVVHITCIVIVISEDKNYLIFK